MMAEQTTPLADVEDVTEAAVAPPWVTILHNCDCHTFEQVVRQLQKAIQCSEAEGWESAWQVHNPCKAGGQRRRRTEDGDGPMGPTRMVLGKPVIAAVEGYAVAGGLELALWCDLRVAAADAVFGVFCRRWGVPLIDLGTVRLPRLIGQSHAMDLILTGRGVSGDEALRMGLANRIVPKGQALATAVSLANELAALPQRCMRSDRMSAMEQWSLGAREAMLNEFHRGMTVINSGESKEGATRFASGAGRHGAKA